LINTDTHGFQKDRCRATERFNGEVFYTLREAQILIERWQHHYNTVGPIAPSATVHRRQKA